MKKQLLITFGILVSLSCVENQRTENPIEKVLFAFENHLIKHGVLEDKKGSSYIKLLQDITIKNDINYHYRFSFIDTLENTKNISITNYLKHQKTLIFNKAKAYETLMSSNTEEMDLHPAMITKRILSITKARDFENNYFKLQFLLFFDLANIYP